MAYVLSMPTDWRHSADSLSHASAEGVHSARAALRELADHGYATLEKVRDESGEIRNRWVFRESPDAEIPNTVTPAPDCNSPNPVEPQSGKPPSGLPSPGETALSETIVDETTGAAATAAAPVPEIDSSKSTLITDGGVTASSVAVATVAAPPDDQSWLTEQLPLLDLRRAQQAATPLDKLDLWQIADVYHAFQIAKRVYPKDIKTARKGRPDLSVWKWFAEQVVSPRHRTWHELTNQWQASNASSRRVGAEESRSKAQPDNPTPNYDHGDWQAVLFELKHGKPPENPIGGLYDTELATLPWQTWDVVPRTMRALLCGNYLPGAVPPIPVHTTRR